MLEGQQRTPLVEALRDYLEQVRAPLHVPGHKQGRWAPEEWRQLIGTTALAMDLTEAPGLDDLHAPDGAIAEAQELAAAAFGAQRSFFLVGGTTAGLHALILTACLPGQQLALPRHAHRAILGAMILADLHPAWVRTRFDQELDIPVGLDLDSLRQAVRHAAAAILVHPTYHGRVTDLSAALDIVKGMGIPALVDEAHGSHFSFHPDMPPAALATGADAVVQSIHKTGGSLTQSSLCHLGYGHLLQATKVQEMLRLVQTSSPSYLLMASLDMARRELALHGRRRWQEALELAVTIGRQLQQIQGIQVHAGDDPTRLVIDVRGRRITGFQAAKALWAQGVAVEMSGWGYVVAIITPGDTSEVAEALLQAVLQLPWGMQMPPRPPEPPWPEVAVSPRQATLGHREVISLQAAKGRIAAELVAPYPPGIPVVAPGERITNDVLAYLLYVKRAGYHLQGPADLTLSTIQVLKE